MIVDDSKINALEKRIDEIEKTLELVTICHQLDHSAIARAMVRAMVFEEGVNTDLDIAHAIVRIMLKIPGYDPNVIHKLRAIFGMYKK